MRTIIELSDDQVAGLSAICEREGISRAEAVRRAVDGMLAQKSLGRRDDLFGAWPSRARDGREVVERLREEWE